MTHNDKLADRLSSPQESLPELEEQVLEKITGGSGEGSRLPYGYNPFGSKTSTNSLPYSGRVNSPFSPNTSGVKPGPVTQSQNDAIKAFDAAKQATLSLIKK